MQDRILGPLTMIQFIYAVVGGGFCYGIYSSVASPFSYLIIIPLALFILALIFLKINERPFLQFLKSILEFSSAPKQRVWRHQSDSDLEIEVYKTRQKTGLKVQNKKISQKEISELAKRIDQN